LGRYIGGFYNSDAWYWYQEQGKMQQRRNEVADVTKELQHLCGRTDANCHPCDKATCEEDARKLAEAYVDAFYANTTGIDLRDVRAGHRCFVWAELVYAAAQRLNLTSFSVDWVGRAYSPSGTTDLEKTDSGRSDYKLAHNMVRIGFRKAETIATKNEAQSCEVILDPWRWSAPKAWYYTSAKARNEDHEWNHIIKPEIDARYPDSLGQGKRWDGPLNGWIDFDTGWSRSPEYDYLDLHSDLDPAVDWHGP
jgi:hypothetical protein